MRRYAVCIGLVALMGCGDEGSDGTVDVTQNATLTTFADYFTGEFRNESHVAELKKNGEDPKKIIEQLTYQIRIWNNETDAYWIYVEQYAGQFTQMDKPFRQRIYKLYPEVDDAIKVAVFKFKDKGDDNKAVDGWKDPSSFSAFNLGSIDALKGCVMSFQRESDQYVGGQADKNCKSQSGYITSETKVSKDKVVNIGKGFTEDGKKTWEAVEDFDKIKNFPL
jgi:hypothetical protein